MIVGLGEILWDLLPDGKKLGGAPANVVYHATQLGAKATVVSRIGADELGQAALEQLVNHHVPVEDVQLDDTHPTGTVEVKLNEGTASYSFATDCTWDYLEWNDQLADLATKASGIVFGTLAQRSAVSRQTIHRFLTESSAPYKLCDINLRPPHYNQDILRTSVELATVLKLNEEEMPALLSALDIDGAGSLADQAQRICAQYHLHAACITQGKNGSLLVTPTAIDDHAGHTINVIDTIGAGDAFTAALMIGLLEDKSLADINALGSAVSSWVATQSGAMPTYTADIQEVLKNI